MGPQSPAESVALACLKSTGLNRASGYNDPLLSPGASTTHSADEFWHGSVGLHRDSGV